jgi:YHS domain-containing protein
MQIKNFITSFLTVAPLLTAMLLSSPAIAGDLVNVAGVSGVALDGYDPVAFFTDKKPVNGDPSITVKHKDATYFFANKEHKAAFESAPEKYLPQCGGYCAFGVSVGALFPVDVNTWQVREGKLYLNLNPEILKAFNKDLAANISKADKNWPGLVKKHSK